MAIPAFLRPRMKDIELRGIIQHLLSDMGSEEFLLMLGSAPMGSNLGKHSSPYLQNRVMGENDYITVLIETNGPGGFYAEIARVFCLNDPTDEMIKVWEDNVKAQKMCAEMLKTGTNLIDLIEPLNQFLAEKGYPYETSLVAHGQGYDLVERPANIPGESMLVKPNMNIAVHPRLSTDTSFTFCCDNFLTTEKGAVRVHKAPQELFVAPH
jgi:Xaa-Pro aminopeptidase